jgi:hypothetical protein
MSSQRISVVITVLFVVAFVVSVCYGECVCGETHELTVTITGTSTLVAVTYTYAGRLAKKVTSENFGSCSRIIDVMVNTARVSAFHDIHP